jgi:hypothetical protein
VEEEEEKGRKERYTVEKPENQRYSGFSMSSQRLFKQIDNVNNG